MRISIPKLGHLRQEVYLRSGLVYDMWLTRGPIADCGVVEAGENSESRWSTRGCCDVLQCTVNLRVRLSFM